MESKVIKEERFIMLGKVNIGSPSLKANNNNARRMNFGWLSISRKDGVDKYQFNSTFDNLLDTLNKDYGINPLVVGCRDKLIASMKPYIFEQKMDEQKIAELIQNSDEYKNVLDVGTFDNYSDMSMTKTPDGLTLQERVDFQFKKH